jgi:Cu-Zn family superoxide dismutase
MTRLRTRTLVATSAVTVGLLATVGAAFAGEGSGRSTGPDFTYGSANPFAAATAAVHVVKTGGGETQVTLHVRDADGPTGQRYGAHVHVNPCGGDGSAAGGHYQHAGAGGTLEAREVWLDFTLNDSGNGHSSASRPWSLDEGSPRSVIIHAMPTNPADGAAGARLACIDLDGEH